MGFCAIFNSMKSKKYELNIGTEKICAEFNDLAENTNGSVILRIGDTVLLATVVASKVEKDMDYFPLSVEYEERYYASGQILGSRFVRREGRPSDEAILSGRIVDRTIRPLFDYDLRREIQVVITILSLDKHDPDILGVIASSLALSVSDIPWNGPVSAVRVGKMKNSGDFLINPSYEQRADSNYELDLIACGKDGTINMIEVGSNEVSEDVLMDALKKANEELQKIQEFQLGIIADFGKKEKFAFPKKEIPEELKTAFEKEVVSNLGELLGEAGKAKIYDLEDKWFSYLEQNISDCDKRLAKKLFDDGINDFIHKKALEDGVRFDNRGFDDIRSLFAKAGGVSSVLHGSGIFYRGGTHIFSALTLGAPGDSQVIDGMEVKTAKRFMHHYNFPPFSSGEVGRIGFTNRRMVGHGALAEKALLPVIPDKEQFPYTIRIVSEAFSSNGSTSMGSVCASSLALMDAGVPITKPVAGIASGLMMKDASTYKVLTDIQGPEDEHGDMDFKVAGTRDGITAVQMDVKVLGIPLPILKEAFEKAKVARMTVLDVLTKEILEPRKEMSPNAPRILSVRIKPEQIGMVIGTGGKVVNEIKESCKVEIDIEDDGMVYITGEVVGAEKARELIESIVREYKIGDKIFGEVVRIADFGAIVRFAKNGDGLVHISEIAPFRVEKLENFIKIGDRVPIVIKDIDDKGRFKLSIKDADPKFFKQPNKN